MFRDEWTVSNIESDWDASRLCATITVVFRNKKKGYCILESEPVPATHAVSVDRQVSGYYFDGESIGSKLISVEVDRESQSYNVMLKLHTEGGRIIIPTTMERVGGFLINLSNVYYGSGRQEHTEPKKEWCPFCGAHNSGYACNFCDEDGKVSKGKYEAAVFFLKSWSDKD